MMQPIDYDSLCAKQRHKNLSDFDVELKCTKKKIENFASRYDIKTSEVLDFIKKYPIEIMFSKDPKKQSLHEKWCYEALCENINELNGTHAILSLLPKTGNNALIIQSGKSVPFDSKQIYSSKTLDMMLTFFYNGTTRPCYIHHKYTSLPAGSTQEAQFIDTIHYLESCKLGLVNKNIFYIALLDGGYYDLGHKSYSSKINYLKTYYNRNNIIICKSHELFAEINKRVANEV